MTEDEQEGFLKLFLSMKSSKIERILQLCRLYNRSNDEAERKEIFSALTECFFRDPNDLIAIPIEEEIASLKQKRFLPTEEEIVALEGKENG